jgi:hypothetical protein
VTLTTDRLRELRATISRYGTNGADLAAAIDELIAAREAAVATDGEVEAAIDEFHYATRKRDVEAARAKLRSLFRRQPAPDLLAALIEASQAVDDVWAAIGDRLLANGPLARDYANSVQEKCRLARDALRDALKRARSVTK